MTPGGQQLDELRRAVLENRLRTGTSRGQRRPPRTSHDGSEPLPLSVSQNQLWYLHHLAPESGAYNELVEIRKTGAFDVDAARRALREVVGRHDSLRTTFDEVEGVPRQFISAPTEVDVALVDLSHLARAEAERQAFEIVGTDAAVPYDLARGPVLRARLVRIADDDHRLYLGMHHLIFDGVTLYNVVFPEFVACYRDYSQDRTPQLPESEAQYADYTVWERDWVAGPQVAARIARWRGRLAGVTPTLPPTDHPLPPGHRFAGGAVPVAVERGTAEALRRIGRQAGGTLFHALAAAYAWWLHSYTGSHDVVFGTPHDLRYRKDLLTVAGYCVTPLVLRCDVTPEESFTALVDRVRDVITDAVSDAVPFETLIGELAIPRDPRNNPLFQTALLLRPPVTASGEEWSVRLVEREVVGAVASTKFDLSMHLDEHPEGDLAGGLFFSSDLFDPATARDMSRHWVRLLDAAAAAPDVPMTSHDLIPDDDRRRQLSWNPSAPQRDSTACVHDVVRAQTERTPDATAVQAGDATLTYRELDDRAEAIAARLRADGVRRGAVVAVQLNRTPDLIATLLGILKCGAAFLPLDPAQPAERNDFCVKETGGTIVVTDAMLDDLPTPPPEAGRSVVAPDDLAYVIYTSGSTGRPKGVLVEHRNVTNLMQTMYDEFGVTAADTVLSVSSITFDVALGDIFCTLARGARLVLATEEQVVNPVALGRLIGEARATYMMATPTAWGALVASGWSGESRLTALCAGETLTDALAAQLHQRCRAVWNAWGPTEATVITGAARLHPGNTITVGTPLPGARVYVVDSQQRMQPAGVPGEVAIGGRGVARGYLNRPDEQARFVDDPFAAGGRLYLTGDRGRFLADGRLQHLGRYDEQVKIRGFRIEPAEIEATLCEHPDVKACAVAAREAPNAERYLVAYVVDEAARLDDRDARDWLRHRLPEYMVPGAFVHLTELPRTATGKLDKAALPAPTSRRDSHSADQPPRTDPERSVAALWAGLLGEAVADVNTDFFDLGGHSLLAVRLLFEVQRTFGVALSLPAFLDSGRTVATLAELIGSSAQGAADETGSAAAPLHFVFPDLPNAMSLRHFVAQWGSAQPVHPIILPFPDAHAERWQGIGWLATQVLPTIRERQPSGPYALLGYSVGAIVAYELAAQLLAAGEEVDWVGILDTPAPPMARTLRTSWVRIRRLQRRPAGERLAKYREVVLRTVRRGLQGPPQMKQFDPRVGREMTCRYEGPGHEVPVHLFVTESTVALAGANLLGWDDFHAGPLDVNVLPGSHLTLLHQPTVDQLVPMVLDSLREAQTTVC